MNKRILRRLPRATLTGLMGSLWMCALVLGPTDAYALPAGWTCGGTLGACRKMTINSAYMGLLEGEFLLRVSAGDGVENGACCVTLTWSDLNAVGTIVDADGVGYLTSVRLNDDFAPSTAYINSPNPEGAPIMCGSLDPATQQTNNYYFEITVSHPLGDVVLVNHDPVLMVGTVDGWPPSVYPPTYTQVGSVVLILESGPPEITAVVPVGTVFGTASEAVVDVEKTHDDCSAFVIPTVSEWGAIVMTLLLLTAGTIVFFRMRRSRAAAA